MGKPRNLDQLFWEETGQVEKETIGKHRIQPLKELGVMSQLSRYDHHQAKCNSVFRDQMRPCMLWALLKMGTESCHSSLLGIDIKEEETDLVKEKCAYEWRAMCTIPSGMQE
jgi:hypothetical protein